MILEGKHGWFFGRKHGKGVHEDIGHRENAGRLPTRVLDGLEASS
jgi:hypothetical protein